MYSACFLQAAGAASVYYSAAHLATLADDFEDCVATLSSIENWNSDQLDELVNLAKAVSHIHE